MVPKNPEYFLTIAAERSVSKAAERLYLSQPYLSQYLARLEKELGARLFDRSHTPLMLTPAGELYRSYLESVSLLGRRLDSQLSELQEHKGNTLHIGVAIWRGSVLLPDILPRYTADHPEVRIVLHEHPSNELLELIQNDVIDFAVLHTPDDTREITYETIFHERLLLAAHRATRWPPNSKPALRIPGRWIPAFRAGTLHPFAEQPDYRPGGGKPVPALWDERFPHHPHHQQHHRRQSGR